MLETTAFMGEIRVSSPMLTLPEGMITFPVDTARITSSGGVSWKLKRSRFGSDGCPTGPFKPAYCWSEWLIL